MAEDLHFYERASIEEWFGRNKSAGRSPVTNAPMRRVLKSAPQVRNTIRGLVESGAITGGKADSWSKRLEQEKEVSLMRQRAQAGDSDAMLTLGEWYENGENGLPKDDAQAFSWFMLAADLGDVRAVGDVGVMYCQGRGVATVISRGAARLGEAAALGSDWACYELGRYHLKGSFGFRKDAAEASYWYSKIPGCTVKDVTSKAAARAAEWLQAYLLQPTDPPKDEDSDEENEDSDEEYED